MTTTARGTPEGIASYQDPERKQKKEERGSGETKRAPNTEAARIGLGQLLENLCAHEKAVREVTWRKR